MANRVTLGFLHAMIAAAGLAVCSWMYVEFVAYNPPVVWQAGSDVYPSKVHAGDTINVTRKFIAKRTEVIRISRSMVSGDCAKKCQAFDLDPSISTSVPGVYTRTRQHRIPAHIPPGVYRLEFDVSWENALGRTYSQRLPPLEIEVVK